MSGKRTFPQVLIVAIWLLTGEAASAPLKVAFFGDLPYGDITSLQKVVAAVGQSDAELAVHIGDIKSGSSRCANELFQQVKREFDQFPIPMVYIPGDNEWTDCHRSGAGKFDPLERLAALRQFFTVGKTTFGKKTLPLQRQSQIKGFQLYSENIQLTLRGVHFIGLHIIGSNNNLGRNKKNDAEYMARDKANLAWMKAGFQQAAKAKAKAIVLLIHANPGFEKKASTKSGFQNFLTELRPLAEASPRPILLVHGDSHTFRVDKPLTYVNEIHYPNFTRLEVFGSPNEHWVRVVIDPDQKNPFLFQPMILSD